MLTYSSDRTFSMTCEQVYSVQRLQQMSMLCMSLGMHLGFFTNILTKMSIVLPEEDDEPKSPRKKGAGAKRKSGRTVFKDDNGRVISREEAKRIRK